MHLKNNLHIFACFHLIKKKIGFLDAVAEDELVQMETEGVIREGVCSLMQINQRLNSIKVHLRKLSSYQHARAILGKGFCLPDSLNKWALAFVCLSEIQPVLSIFYVSGLSITQEQKSHCACIKIPDSK